MRHSILLVLAALASLASAQSSSGSTSATIVAPNATTPTAGSSSSMMQCEICRDTGNCSKVSRGAPGQYCHESTSAFTGNNYACCCPARSTCSPFDSHYRCTCDPQSPNHGQTFWAYAILGFLLITFGVTILMSVWWRHRRHRRGDRLVGVFVQQPVYVQGGYPQQGYAAETSLQPVYSQRGHPTNT